MKKLLLAAVLVLSSVMGFSQWTKPNNSYGTIVNRIAVDSAMLYPTGCGAPTSLKARDIDHSAFYFDSCGATLYVYDPSSNLWITAGASVKAGWGQTKSHDTIYAGGRVDGIIGYYVRNNWSPGTPQTTIQYSNHLTFDSLAPGVPGTVLNRPIGLTDGTYATAMMQFNIDHKESYRDTANLQYGNGVSIIHRYSADSTPSMWGKLGVKKVFTGRDMGFHVTNQLFFPIDTVDVYADIDGRSGASYNSMFGLGASWGYNIRIFSRDTLFPFVGGYSSVLDLQREASRTRMRRVTGNGITSYVASIKGWQAAISPSTTEVGHYINKIYGFVDIGETATTSTGGADKAKILRVSTIDTVISFFSAPKWTSYNEVKNGYGFVAVGDSDYNYMARHLKIGGALPTRGDGKTKHLFEVVSGEGVFKNSNDKIRVRLNGIAGTTPVFAQDVFDGSLYDYSSQISAQSFADSASKMRKGYSGTFVKEMFPVDGVSGQFNNIFATGGVNSSLGIHPQKGVDSIFISQDFNTAATWSNLSLQGFYDSSDLKFYGPSSSRVLNGISNVLARLDVNSQYGILRGTINNFTSSIRGSRKANSEIEWINHFAASQPFSAADNGQKTKTIVGLYIEGQKTSIVNRAWGVLSLGTQDYSAYAGTLAVGDTTVANFGRDRFYVGVGTSRFMDTVTATTMGISDSSNRVATTAWVKRQAFGGGGGGGGPTAWSDIANPTADQSLTWDAGESSTWTNNNTTEDFLTVNTSTVTTASIIKLVSTSTALAAGNRMLDIAMSGANASSSITATGAKIAVTNTGTTSSNIGIDVSASGATNNYAILARGRVFSRGDSEPTGGFFIQDAAGSQNTGRVSRNGGTGGLVVTSTFTELSLIGATSVDIYGGTASNVMVRPQGGGLFTVGPSVFTPLEMLHVDGNIQAGRAGTTQGSFKLAGLTSGIVTIAGQASAGTYNFNLPTTAGTAGDILTSGGGGAAAMTWTSTLGVANGGTGLSSVTANRIPYGNGTSALQTSSNFTFDGSTFSIGSSIQSNVNGNLLFGKNVFFGIETAADANITPTVGSIVILPTITANRTVTVTPGSSNNGRLFVIINQNSTAFTWTFSGSVKDALGNTITTIPVNSVITMYSDGTDFRIASLSQLNSKNTRPTSITSSSTPTPNINLSDTYSVTALATNATFGAPPGTPVDGQILLIRIKDNGTARTLSWNPIYRSGSDIALPSSTTISKWLYVQVAWNGVDNTYDCVGKSDGY